MSPLYRRPFGLVYYNRPYIFLIPKRDTSSNCHQKVSAASYLTNLPCCDIGLVGRLIGGQIGAKCSSFYHTKGHQATIEKSMFPVQRLAEIVTSWVAAKSFFPVFCCCKKLVKMIFKSKKKVQKLEKKVPSRPPHRNNFFIFFKGATPPATHVHTYLLSLQHCIQWLANPKHMILSQNNGN